MTQSVEPKVRELIALVLEKKFPAGQAITRAKEPQWNSLKHVELIFALEDAFGVRFSEQDMVDMDSIAAIVAVLDRRHAA
jgi:acyl carrier protein